MTSYGLSDLTDFELLGIVRTFAAFSVITTCSYARVVDFTNYKSIAG